MSDVYRVVQRSNGDETHRSVDLIDACICWVRRPNDLRVEQLEVGSNVAKREVPAGECCAALRHWLSTTQLVTVGERQDLAVSIREACGGA
jgi:hypothetical protein